MVGRFLLVGDPIVTATADVFKAYDTGGEFGEVAVKILRSASDPYYKEALSRELRALQRLKHDHVVPLLASGSDTNTGQPYLVFPWFKRRLQDSMRATGAITWPAWWEQFGRPIVVALEAAHALQLQHRDLKPANVMLDDDGRPVLIDFGISRFYTGLPPEVTVDGASSPFTPPELVHDSPEMTRDTHAWAALTVFALAGIDPYAPGHDDPWESLELARQGALPRLPPPVRSVVDLCLSKDPHARPNNAAILASQLDVALERHRRDLARVRADSFPEVPILLRDAVTYALGDELDLYTADVTDLLSEELDSTVYIVPLSEEGRYLLIAATLSVRIAIHPDGHALVATSAARPPTSVLDRDRERGWPASLRFSLGEPEDRDAASTAVREFIQRIGEFNFDGASRRERTQHARPFTVWRTLLSLLRAYEAHEEEPLTYIAAGSNQRGSGVRFDFDRRLNPSIQGDIRVAPAEGGREFFGTVRSVRDDYLIIEPDPAGAAMPSSSGTLRRDRRASQSALERQQRAIDTVEYGRALRADLADLLIAPGSATEPVAVSDLEFRLPLDAPKQRAIEKAVASRDILVVRGPPGTGKTTFIVELVLQELDRDPDVRILIASQSNAAVDHALAGVAEHVDPGSLVRIARVSSERVADTSKAFILDMAIARWRAEAINAGEGWLRKWAGSVGISPADVEAATRLTMLAGDLRRLDVISSQRAEIEERIRTIRTETRNLAQGSTTAQTLREHLDELEELRGEEEICRDEIREHVDGLVAVGQLPRRTSRSALSADELDERAEALLPSDADATQQCRTLLNLLKNWHAQFGLGAAFFAAAIARASVVAATCVGFAGQRGSEAAEFDLVIVDEASKATAPELLIPLSRGTRFVLVGDDQQLPPYVEGNAIDLDQLADRGVSEDEIKRPLFATLFSALPEANVVRLTHQHRMHPSIGHLISHCFYDDELTSEPREPPTWLSMLAPRPVTWLTTAPYGTNRFETYAAPSYVNELESRVIATFLNTANALAKAARTKVTVAVLTGYAAQRDALAVRLGRDAPNWTNLEIECSTVDAFQGRQAKIVLFSVTRSNSERRLGFVRDRPRLNVALSRAEDTLVIVGDHIFARAARGSLEFRRVLSHIDEFPEECTLMKARVE
jgi:serine/threonine protein kinase